MARKIQLIVIAAGLFTLAGCSRPQQPCYKDNACIASTNLACSMEHSAQVLRNMHFVIDKMDTEAGYLSTQPLPGAQLVEFWRKDNVGTSNTMEANLHSLTRRVEMTFTPQDNATNVEVRVFTNRLSVKEREVASISESRRILSKSSSSLQGLNLNAKDPDIRWIPLGRDNLLEDKIVTLLLK